jgi:hypothetical protein
VILSVDSSLVEEVSLAAELENGMNEENEKWSGRDMTPRNRKNVGRKAHAMKTNKRNLVSFRSDILRAGTAEARALQKAGMEPLRLLA